jgi:uncharacterized protein YrrD
MSKEQFKTQELVGKSVISLGGKELGTVNKVIVDPGSVSVAGFTINVKGILKGDKAIEFKAVHSFGDYALTIADSAMVVPLNTLPALEKLAQFSNMYGMKVITPSGHLVGGVDDFTFATVDGKITGYIISGGLIKNLMQGRAVIPAEGIEKIGPDLIIAKDGIEQYIVKEEPGLHDSIGNLKEDINLWKEDLNKTWDKTLIRARELSKTIGENLKEATKEGRGRSKELIGKSAEILNEKKKDLKTTYEEWSDRLKSLKNKPEKPLSEDELAAVTGQKVSKTITDENGEPIINQDEVITDDTVRRAAAAGRLKELLLAAATSDVSQKIESIEKDI